MSKISEVQLESLQEQEKKKGAILHDLGLLQTKVNINLQDGSYEIIKDEEDK